MIREHVHMMRVTATIETAHRFATDAFKTVIHEPVVPQHISTLFTRTEYWEDETDAEKAQLDSLYAEAFVDLLTTLVADYEAKVQPLRDLLAAAKQ